MTAAAGIASRVVEASMGRDRVLDAVKAVALLLVIVGHSLAWHVRDGEAVNVLEEATYLIPLTWLFQVLPLFFAAGAVSNAASLQRHGPRAYLAARGRRLLAPVVVYATFWTLLLLPFSASDQVQGAGRFLGQLLWFAAVYLLVAAGAVLTRRWTRRPLLALGLWLLVVLALDLLRMTDAEGPAWLNMVVAWGWLHQLGYHLPELKGRTWTLFAGPALMAAAVALALLGPYSSSLVTVAGVPGLSNLAPPSIVLVLFGAGQVLLLAGLWPQLEVLLTHDRLWVPVALMGARGMGMYLWHIPLVGLAAGAALLTDWSPPPLGAAWWAVHLTVAALVVPGAWLLAGVAHRSESWLLGHGSRPVAPGAGCVVGGLAVLSVSTTGFATVAGAGALGMPSSAPVNLAALLLSLWLVGGWSRRDQHGHREQAPRHG
jgi:fucose 4-O-acetylase-like acetyltransferase